AGDDVAAEGQDLTAPDLGAVVPGGLLQPLVLLGGEAVARTGGGPAVGALDALGPQVQADLALGSRVVGGELEVDLSAAVLLLVAHHGDQLRVLLLLAGQHPDLPLAAGPRLRLGLSGLRLRL